MRLTRVERAMRALHAQGDMHRQALNTNYCNAPLGAWQPAAPHASLLVSLGGNVHTDLVVKSDNRTTAEVIAGMIGK